MNVGVGELILSKSDVSPLQLTNSQPESGVAVKDTLSASSKSAPQVLPQSITIGVLVTVPLPTFDIVSV